MRTCHENRPVLTGLTCASTATLSARASARKLGTVRMVTGGHRTPKHFRTARKAGVQRSARSRHATAHARVSGGLPGRVRHRPVRPSSEKMKHFSVTSYCSSCRAMRPCGRRTVRCPPVLPRERSCLVPARRLVRHEVPVRNVGLQRGLRLQTAPGRHEAVRCRVRARMSSTPHEPTRTRPHIAPRRASCTAAAAAGRRRSPAPLEAAGGRAGPSVTHAP
jgi:hypothetical protein